MYTVNLNLSSNMYCWYSKKSNHVSITCTSLYVDKEKNGECVQIATNNKRWKKNSWRPCTKIKSSYEFIIYHRTSKRDVPLLLKKKLQKLSTFSIFNSFCDDIEHCSNKSSPILFLREDIFIFCVPSIGSRDLTLIIMSVCYFCLIILNI